MEILNDGFNDRISFQPEDIVATSDELGVDGLNIEEKDDAQENLEKIDGAIKKISENRQHLVPFKVD